MRLFSPPNVAGLKAGGDWNGLIKALSHAADPRIRQAAARACGELREVRAIDRLIGLLDDPVAAVRSAARSALVAIGAPAVESLLATLTRGSEPARTCAAWALADLRDVRTLDTFLGALRDPSASVRCQAARALGNLGERQATDALVTALADPEPDVRQTAVEALRLLGDTRTAGALVGLLADAKRPVRQAAARALARLGPPVTGVVAASLPAAEGDARRVMADLLDAFGWQSDQGPAGAAYRIARNRWDECVAIGAPAIPPLVKSLADRDPDVRQAAAATLERMDWSPPASEIGAQYWIARGQIARCVEIGAPAVTVLIRLIESDPALEVFATLGHLRDARAVDALARWACAEGQVGAAACAALAEIGDGRAVPVLIGMLPERVGSMPCAGEQSVVSAIAALGTIGDPRAVPALITTLYNAIGKESTDATLLEAAGRALVTMGAPAVEPLIAALRGELPSGLPTGWRGREFWDVIARALGDIGDPRAVSALVAAVEQGRWCPHTFEALAQIGGVAALGYLLASLRSGYISHREAAASVLARLDVPEAHTGLKSALQDNDCQVRLAAVRSIAQLRDPSAFDDLVAALGDPDEQVCRVALELVAESSDPRVMETLIACLEVPSDSLRGTLVEVLSGREDARAADGLARLLNDPNVRVRRQAALALAQRQDPRGADALRTENPAESETVGERMQVAE